jgi:hypothetical protein
MSDGPIKAADIPQSALSGIRRTLKLRRVQYCEPDLVVIANALIDAGIVSPPCHYIERDGEIVRHGGAIRLWPGKPDVENGMDRHWRGES